MEREDVLLEGLRGTADRRLERSQKILELVQQRHAEELAEAESELAEAVAHAEVVSRLRVVEAS